MTRTGYSACTAGGQAGWAWRCALLTHCGALIRVPRVLLGLLSEVAGSVNDDKVVGLRRLDALLHSPDHVVMAVDRFDARNVLLPHMPVRARTVAVENA